MLDFLTIEATTFGKHQVRIEPNFIVTEHPESDLMIKGGDFYAIWDEKRKMWSTNQVDCCRIIDPLVQKFADQYETEKTKDVLLMRNFSTDKWMEFRKYCKSLPDSYHDLDVGITFSNEKPRKRDYVSRSVPYPLEEGPIDAYEELMSTLYEAEERRKIEWAIGSVIAGDSKNIQKFFVFYGAPGTGKSTVLHIIEDLFEGYWSVFEAKELSSASNSFALETFRNNPLIAIQHDGDLSRIEDNTKLNSIVAHEDMLVNEKFKTKYRMRFNALLFLGTNKPVMITDAKSGLIRRLIDVNPSGHTIPYVQFNKLLQQIKFEHSGIAYHCLQVYREMGISYYDTYRAKNMMSRSNDFYNFMEDNYYFFTKECEDGKVSLNTAWMRYKDYCADANIPHIMKKRIFKNEMMEYFEQFHDRLDSNQRSIFEGFRKDKFEYGYEEDKFEPHIAEESEEIITWIRLDQQDSIFDQEFADWPAQYAKEDGSPKNYWSKVKTKLSDLKTSREHYILPQGGDLIMVDFDLKDENGKKDLKRNIQAATRFPRTYAETSKSGGGLHLYYRYDGDVERLSRIFEEHIEVKVYPADSKQAIRRKLTVCNNLRIAIIPEGFLPQKRGERMITTGTLKTERSIRAMILRNLKKEIHEDTTSSINFIHKILEDAYNNGVKYDVTDMRPDIQVFAANATNGSAHCLRMVSRMKFKSEEPSENVEEFREESPIVFFDVEVLPNLFVVVWKKQGKDQPLMKWVNPEPSLIEGLTKMRLVGFNNRLYDNHILYARMMGYSEEKLFELSQRIIKEKRKDALFGEAYNLSYTDIYDFLSATHKMSLKKWEIKLGIHHKELGLPWDKPVPKELWDKISEYCAYDVLATEAVWDANQADWTARQILAALSGLTVNDTTNQHTTRIIVGTDRNPQSQYIYTDLSTIFPGYRYDKYGIPKEEYNLGTKIVSGKSIYMGEDPGEGGQVYAEPGIYSGVKVLDIASMHPHTIIRLKIFGEYYTMRFKDIVDARIFIKHGEYDKAKKLLDGKLAPYLEDESKAEDLADALKTAINSVYGLTSAKFPNKLRDPRNEDNIVAKHGALFMINLRKKVQEMGYTVVHVKTDSIKIAEADDRIIQFVMDYGKEYGYTFELEDSYSKMCLVNESTYIARYETPYKDKKTGKDIWWTATGAQFQVPYIFKTLFSKEELLFDDLCETKSVSSALYLDFNEELEEGQHDYRFVGKVGKFCPIRPGCGGAELLRQSGEDKYAAATGTKKKGKVEKGESEIYRWMEAEMVKELGYEEYIDMGYFRELLDGVIDAISVYGDFDMFVSDDILDAKSIRCGILDVPEMDEDEELPFDPDPKEFMNRPIAA